jgi:7-cyano-7-deazaguanine synthase
MMEDLAIVLVSGGMDSAVVAAKANTLHKNLAFLHIQYGQNTQEKEYDCFVKLADFYKIPNERRKVIDISFLNDIGGSSLTDDSIDVSTYEGDSDIIPTSYVPFRNTHILSMAVSWAEVMGAQKIYIGANYEDSPGYPDCRPEYYEAFNNLIQKGTKEGSIEVLTPVIMMTKKEIVELGDSLGTPFNLTWSCYKSGDKACGVCDSCALRLRGFKQAGKTDPISYE